MAKFAPTLGNVYYSTYIGGSKQDIVQGLDVDATGCAYISGYTYSGDYPVLHSIYFTLKPDSSNIFITKFNQDASQLLYSTNITASNNSFATDLVVCGNNYAHITGYTNAADMPITWDAFFLEYSGFGDAFYSVLNETGDSVIFSSYIGGDQYERAYALALDNVDAAYICGATTSQLHFPHSTVIADSLFDYFEPVLGPGGDTISLIPIYRKTLGSWDCFVFKSMYKPYPGELATNIDTIMLSIGNMFCPGSSLVIRI